MYGVVAKQDRTPVRTPANIEQKYELDKDFKQIEQTAINAQKTANAANFTANSAAKRVEELSQSTAAQFEEVASDVSKLGNRVTELEDYLASISNGDEVAY